MTDAADLPPPTAQGTLAKTPFAHLLVYALERALTGSIALQSDGASVIMVVIEGCPSKARTSEAQDHLGTILEELGFVSPEVLDQSLARMNAERRLHGQILLEMGAITHDQLLDGLRAQLARKLSSAFALPPETTFAYYEGVDLLHGFGGAEGVVVDPYPLVWGSIREAPSWEHVHNALSRVGRLGMRVPNPGVAARFQFTRAEAAAVELMASRPIRLHELTATKALSPSAAQLLVYCLMITKQMELIETPSGHPPGPAGSAAAQAAQSQAFARVQLSSRAVQRGTVVEESSSELPFDNRSASPMPMAIPLQDGAAAPVGARGETAPPLSPEHAAQRQRIDEMARAIQTQDYFQMLGVDREAQTADVQKAFIGLAKTWHPDRLPPALADMREPVTKIFSLLSEAHGTLIEPKRREHYMMLLKEGGATPEEQEQVAQILEAATEFQKAEHYLKRNDLQKAEEHVRHAYQLDDKQPDYVAMLAWLEALKPENTTEAQTLRRIEMLDRAIRMNEKCERAYFWRGMLYKRLERTKESIKDFKVAMELNEHNIDAAREVRLYRMRRSGPSSSIPPAPGGRTSVPPTPPPKGGLFGKLFKK